MNTSFVSYFESKRMVRKSNHEISYEEPSSLMKGFEKIHFTIYSYDR